MSGQRRDTFDPDVWMDALSQLALDANLGVPGEALLDRVAAVTCRLTGFDYCAVLLADPAGERLRIEGFAGLTRDYVEKINSSVPLLLGRQAPGEMSPSSRAFTTAAPTWVVDLQTDEQFRSWAQVARDQDYHTLLVVPLRVGDTIAGTLNCYARTQRGQDPDTMRIVAALADYAGATIQMARLRSTDEDRLRELVSVNEQLRAQKQQLEQLDQIHSELTGVALAGGEVAEIVSALSTILDGAPVRVDTIDGAPLAWAPDEKASTFVPATDPQTAHPTLSKPIAIDGELVADLHTGVPASTATVLQRQAVEHAATVCQVLLCQDRIARDAEARFLGDLVADIVSDNPARVEGAMERARRAGYSSTVTRRMVIVHPLPQSPLNQAIAMQGLAHRLVGTTSDVVVGRYETNLLLLWPEPDGVIDPRLAEALNRLIRPDEAIAAIGQKCASVLDYARAYRIARGAVNLSNNTGKTDSVVTLADLGIYELLLQLDDMSVVADFAAATLRPLWAYDQERGTELVQTLRTYIGLSCHTEATAQAMFVHANTINLRLRCIEKLLGISFAKPDDLLKVSASLMADNVVRSADWLDRGDTTRLTSPVQ